jgi:hypothetical protein
MSSAAFKIPHSTGCIVPDALFGLEYFDGSRKRYRFFALEIDRGTMPIVRSNPHQTSYLSKLAAYAEILAGQVYKSHLGLPNLLVLTVTTCERHKQAIMQRLHGNSGEYAAFLFQALPRATLAFPLPSLLEQAWERVGHSPFAICTASLLV